MLILLISGLVLGLYLLSQKTGFFSRAGASTAPEEMVISNISDNSFTVSWITQKNALGFLTYGDTFTLGNTQADDRDVNSATPRTTHHVTLKNLEPGKNYYFKIGSGGESYDEKGQPFTQTTAPTSPETPPLPQALVGKVLKSDQKPSAQSLIYISVGDSSLISGYTGEDGNFLLTLNNSRVIDLSGYINIKDTDLINISVQGGKEGTVTKQVPASQRGQVQTLVLEGATQENNIELGDDLNGDGVVNAFDFALRLKGLLISR